MNALHRAGRDAEIATGTFAADHGMHLLGSTENGIDRTGLYAQRATDTNLFINNHDCFVTVLAVFGVQWLGVFSEQVGKCLYGTFAARRTLVDISLVCGDGFRIRTTAGIGALAALGLWQQLVNLVNYRVTLDAKTDCRVTQHQANHGGQ